MTLPYFVDVLSNIGFKMPLTSLHSLSNKFLTVHFPDCFEIGPSFITHKISGVKLEPGPTTDLRQDFIE